MFFFANNDEQKIFGIGLSRSGTSSLNAALNMLGFRTLHWRIYEERRLLSVEDCYLCDGITDINAAFMFETLFHMFPNAKFIYTTRPLKDWVKSISHHYDSPDPQHLKSRLDATPVVYPANAHTGEENTLDFHIIHHALYTNHKTWEDAYNNHEKRVKAFFGKRQENFLRFDIFRQKHGWPELCDFLGVKPPKEPYPLRSWKRPDTPPS